VSEQTVAGGYSKVVDETEHFIQVADAVATGKEGFRNAFFRVPLHVLQSGAQSDLVNFHRWN